MDEAVILVDTSAWVEFDRAAGSTTDLRLTELIATTDEVAVTEPVVMEVLGAALGDAPPTSVISPVWCPHAWLRIFVVRCCRVEIRPSARRHGIDDDILHAVEFSLVVDDVGEDPDRWLVIGPDRAGNLIEVVVVVTAEGDELIIHAMALRAAYRKLLEQ